MSAGSLAAKAALVLVIVAVIGKYSDDTHTTTTTTSSASSAASPSVPAAAPATTGSIQAQAHVVFGADYSCAANIITRESGWNPHAQNPSSSAYGLPQALPGDKMATAGADWRDNPATQLAWMKTYVDSRYGGACPAWTWWQAHHWY
ncbi:MAG TPA: transglycosylase SLT domain-containing protein [Pseudonocardiaceae bacterium]|jgi:hypothetical protein|nr:transglycosylase SLT domain-containing protein [Pseudonocardiaceae bacterium]